MMRGVVATVSLVLAMAGCDSLLVEPRSPTSVSVAFNLMAQADSFDAADSVMVRVAVEGNTHEQVLPVSARQTELRARFELELQSGDVSAQVTVEVRDGWDALFEASQTVTLRRGVENVLTLAATPVDPCTRAVPLPFEQTIIGEIVVNRDCVHGTRFADYWRISLGNSSMVSTRITANGFSPLLAAHTPNAGRQYFGLIGPLNGSFTVEHAMPAGTYWLEVANGVNSLSSPGGTYTLTTSTITEAQATNCPVARNRTFVTFGSVASGQIGSNDCPDTVAPDAATVRRYSDGYGIYLLAGETVTATVSTTFNAWFTRWELNAGVPQGVLVQGLLDLFPGQPRTIAVTAATPGYHHFYVLNAASGGAGSYTISFASSSTPVPQPGIIVKSVTSAGAPVALNNVQGVIDVTFTVSAQAGITLTRVDGLLDGNAVCTSSLPFFSTGGNVDVTCSINTVQFPNGTHTLAGRLVRPIGATDSGQLAATINN